MMKWLRAVVVFFNPAISVVDVWVIGESRDGEIRRKRHFTKDGFEVHKIDVVG